MTRITLPAHKLIVGLTGNIATGKSAVMRLAAERGALTIDADKVVHHILSHDAEVQAAIVEAFGEGVARAEGGIDRGALGKLVFSDEKALRKLEGMVHPAVHRHIFEQINSAEADTIVIEAIKLLEGRLHTICHQIWVTRCTRQRQLDRLQICRGMALDEAETRVDAQNPQEAKVARADVVIDTNGLMRDTQAQVEMAWSRLPNPATIMARTVAAPPPPRRTRVQSGPSSSAESPAAPVSPLTYPDNLNVRRARPSDVPSILLLMQQTSGDAQPRSRTDLLLALGQHGYFIGQMGAQVLAVVSWQVDSNVGRIDEVYVQAGESAVLALDAILTEIERSARQHIAALSVAVVQTGTDSAVVARFRAHGYLPTDYADLAEVGQEAMGQSPPEGSRLLVKSYRGQGSR